jgi:DinB family protein
MDDGRRLCAAFLDKLHEQIDRVSHLISLAPPDRPEWTPPIPAAWPLGMVLGHLLDCAAGFCAVLAAVEPARLAHFALLREWPVNRPVEPAGTVAMLARYREHIDQGFALLTDQDLARLLPTVFVPQGEPVLTLLLGNLEHLINHKYQLFTYLKMMGVELGSADLYRFRG